VIRRSFAQDAVREPGDPMLGHSKAMKRVRRAIGELAPIRAPVLVRGESGTGKELAALRLHQGSGRAGPFVPVNCGALGESLAESALFGHRRGAFTGAIGDRAGAFERAHEGTLFLDEVAELPPPLQAMLLRVLETRRVLPIGAEEEIAVDVRLVAATHRDLEALVGAGRFREDLYHRLRVLELVLPPLRARPDDVPLLLDYFAVRAAMELGRQVTFRPEAIEAACRHAWPGNVRALRNAVLRAAARAEGPIDASALLDDAPLIAEGIVVPRGDYQAMNRALLRKAVAEHGSLRRAAIALGIPRSTLSAWLRR
jgi:DNA-binding NtrC family response regulator